MGQAQARKKSPKNIHPQKKTDRRNFKEQRISPKKRVFQHQRDVAVEKVLFKDTV
jgi:hypothetical protein